MPASNGVAANTVLGGARGNLIPFINYLQAAPLLALRDFFGAHATQPHVLTQINGIGTCVPFLARSRRNVYGQVCGVTRIKHRSIEGLRMFHVSRRGENRIDIDFSGKLDSQAMRAALDDLLFKSEGISHGRMLYRIGDFDLPTLGAVGVELSRLPHLFRFIRRFDRCAVVAGKEWLRKASEVEGALIPGLTIKAFDLHQEAEASAWLEHG